MWWWKFLPKLDNEVGGGSKPSAPVIVQPPPPQITQGPAPNPSETSRQLYEAQLQYNPLLTQQSVDLQTKFAPQLAQSEFDTQAKFGPMFRTMYEQMFPSQTQGLETLSQQALQRFQSPQGLTPQQQAAQDFTRQRASDELSRNIRQQANLGGTLYGGHRQEQERRAQAELQNQFALSDIGLQDQRRSQALQEFVASSQPFFPSIQQPSVPSYTQGVTPSPDALMQAIQSSYLVNPSQVFPGTAGRSSGIAQGLGSAAGAAGMAKIMFMCLPGETLIDTSEGSVPIEAVRVGTHLADGELVLMKYEYVNYPTTFFKLVLDDRSWVETCDRHLIDGKEAQAYHEGEELQGRTIVQIISSVREVMTYDLLTTREDGGYDCCGIHVQSMIPTMHRFAQQLQEVA